MKIGFDYWQVLSHYPKECAYMWHRAGVNYYRKYETSSADAIKHFDRTHFTAETIGGRKFVYCPNGNIVSWSEGDHENKWCHYCKKYFEEIAKS